MTVTIIKVGLIVIALLLIASLATTKRFYEEIFIPASPDEVWSVLMDTESYPEWNPVFVKIDGTYTNNESVMSHVKDPKGKVMKMKATVRNLEPGKELRQTGGMPGVITFDHKWVLTPTEGGTKVAQDELDRGGFLWFWNSDWINPAYAEVNRALKERVVSLKTP